MTSSVARASHLRVSLHHFNDDLKPERKPNLAYESMDVAPEATARDTEHHGARPPIGARQLAHLRSLVRSCGPLSAIKSGAKTKYSNQNTRGGINAHPTVTQPCRKVSFNHCCGLTIQTLIRPGANPQTHNMAARVNRTPPQKLSFR
jgi:hypothetical protein